MSDIAVTTNKQKKIAPRKEKERKREAWINKQKIRRLHTWPDEEIRANALTEFKDGRAKLFHTHLINNMII